MRPSRFHGAAAGRYVGLAALCIAAACAAERGDEPAPVSAAVPNWVYDSTLMFPADRSLARPEDGVALPDGRLIVADQVYGLRLVQTDGASAPFGQLAAAGYAHRPPDRNGGANGVSLEPGGTHLLLADVFGGGIYRVDVSSGETERVYQHRYGVNTAVRDSRGAVWFTQSAHNTPEEGEPRLWAAVDIPRPEGALLRLGFQDGRFAGAAELVVDSLEFANGLAIDEATGDLYLAETLGARVLRYRVDLAAGRVTERKVFVDSVGADNLELDGAGNLWIADPLRNLVLVVNPATGERRSVFHMQTPEQQRMSDEFGRRGQAGTPRLELFSPALWSPLPGPVTGVIVGPGTGPVYLTGLGNAILRLPR